MSLAEYRIKKERVAISINLLELNRNLHEILPIKENYITDKVLKQSDSRRDYSRSILIPTQAARSLSGLADNTMLWKVTTV